MKIRFATQSYRLDSKPVSAQRLVNMYAEAQPPDAKTDVAVHGVPGSVDFASCGSGPVRGFRVLNGTLYAVSGGFLYSISSAGVAAAVGGQVSGLSPVSMSDNGTQICIVNGTQGYIYTTDSGFQLITDSNFHAANTVIYIDGFFVFDRAGTNEFFISDSLDGLSYSDFFASAEWQSDNVVAVLNFLERLVVLGEKTTEFWINLGAANFPFQRQKGAGMERGILAAQAIAKEPTSFHFIGNDRIAYRGGSGLVRTSTSAIEQAWQKYPVASDAHALTYTFEGHQFIYFTFPTQGVTWGIDVTAGGLWHERQSWDEHGQSLGRWRGNCAIECYGKVLIGDAFSGRVGYLDRATFTEFGNTIRAEMISPPIHNDRQRMFMPYFELDVETGVGLSSGQGSDPQVMLSISDDGGRTFSDQEPWRSMGKVGAYQQRLRWDRLGSFYERYLRVTISDPVRRTVIAAHCPGLR